MIKANALNKGDKVAIVSLSGGMLGEQFCKHDVQLGKKRLEEFGLKMVTMPNTLRGIAYLKDNPKARADDLKRAFADDSIKGIICAIGGDDTYKTLPYLMDDASFIDNVITKPKIFTGFSDSTVNHLMFYKIGLTTYYGPNFINDLAELANEMLPYTRESFAAFFGGNGFLNIYPSDVWYEERTDFSPASIGTNRVIHKEIHGYELLQGSGLFSGKLLGGCVDTLLDVLTGDPNHEAKEICDRYNLFPDKNEWIGKILFLETSENCISPEKLCIFLTILKEKGIFEVVNGVLIGKPQNEIYYEEYKEVYKRILNGYTNLSVVYNINFGHAYPRTVLAYGINVNVDIKRMSIKYVDHIVDLGSCKTRSTSERS